MEGVLSLCLSGWENGMGSHVRVKKESLTMETEEVEAEGRKDHGGSGEGGL